MSDNEKVYGWKDLSLALLICSKNPESDRKAFLRRAKKYKFPVYQKNRRIFMFKKDIDTINNFYLFGTNEISKYMGLHVKTLYRWFKDFPKMPVDRERSIVFKPALDLWYAIRLWSKKNKAAPTFFKGNALIVESFGSVLYAMDRLGFSHPKELKRYWLLPENDILKAFFTK